MEETGGGGCGAGYIHTHRGGERTAAGSQYPPHGHGQRGGGLDRVIFHSFKFFGWGLDSVWNFPLYLDRTRSLASTLLISNNHFEISFCSIVN